MFCDPALAARIERAEAQLIIESNVAAHDRRRGDPPGFAIPVAGGVASFAEDGSPLNKVAGLGFDGVPEPAELAEIERAFADLGTPVQAEVATLADPAIALLLTGRGYRLVSFENVLGRALPGDHGPVTPAGIEIRPSGQDEIDRWLEVMADGVAVADTDGVPSHEGFTREVLLGAMRDLATAGGVRRYGAWHDGEFAGGASLRISAGIAQFGGAATVPAHRRRGIQSALLAARLADAAAAGCEVAVITTQPGSTSQRNAQRRGFDLLYTRAILVLETA
ncbi:GNAT family N-acetyltransferase [Frankia sp. R82]|uniref:GNAT family N-acetyltransferase n=1 Tax=Frankia sp. R82 TaxID=2950553 RepID=UPI002042FB18|nr:GNAT family N-acetyltransferase [Frankia sp. R82]MCM3886071.1 GNAT family N-acetyltransferase [Frankia sp. R82]